MILKIRVTVLCSIFCLMLCGATIANELEKTEIITSIGMGVDADKARKNAIRNAVEQVVGTFVTSDTMVKDSALIKDEILTFSSGYVKESKVISTETVDDLIRVRLEAVVVSTRLKQKIQSLNIAMIKVDNESLFGEAFSKIDENVSKIQVFNRLMSKYPKAAYVIHLEKPVIKRTDSATNIVTITLNMKLRWDQTFLEEFNNTLSSIALKKANTLNYSSERYRIIDMCPVNKNKDLQLVMLSKAKYLNKTVAEKIYCVDFGKQYLDKGLIKELAEGSCRSGNCTKIKLEFLDKNNNIINVETINYKVHPQHEHYSYSVLRSPSYPAIYNTLFEDDRSGSYRDTIYGFIVNADEIVNMSHDFELGIDEIKNIVSIKAYVISDDSE